MQLKSIHSVRKALDNKEVSALELAKLCLEKAEKLSHLNAFLHIDHDLTLAQAKVADELIAKGNHSILTGIPIAHKDVFVTKGWRTTASSKMLSNYVSPFDATVVEHLLSAGAVNIGKLNCDEFAMGSGNENSAFGPCKNPWDLNAVPGGSSGGSAAAVAAGIVCATTGTDTGGSVRQPSALCGVSGIKPTYGSVSRYGMIAFASSLDQAGPIAHTCEDLVEMLDVMSGFDPKDSTSLEVCGVSKNAQGRVKSDFQASLSKYNSNKEKPLSGVRIGVPKEYFAEGLSDEVKAATEAAIEKFVELGARRVEVSLPRTKYAIPAYYVIAPAEASSNLSRYDGVRYGHRSSNYQGIEQMMSRSRSEGFGPEVQRRIMVGTYVLSHGYYDAYYLQAQRVRRLLAQDFDRVLKEECDFIVGPVTPTVAKNIGENSDDVTADWLADIYTLGVSLAGLPGMSIPCGFGGTEGRRPIGLQIVGKHFDEGALLALGHVYQLHTDWHLKELEVA